MPVLTSRLLREPSVAGFPTLTGIPLCSPPINFAANCGCQFFQTLTTTPGMTTRSGQPSPTREKIESESRAVPGIYR
jgi:hypothetical protein